MNILFSLLATRDLERVPDSDRLRILAMLEQFEQLAERNVDRIISKKNLPAQKIDNHLLEIRVGAYRAICRIDDNEMLVINIFQKNSIFDEKR